MPTVVSEQTIRPSLTGIGWRLDPAQAAGGGDRFASQVLETIRELPEWGAEVEAQMSEWTADLDAESLAIHEDLANASFRTLSDD